MSLTYLFCAEVTLPTKILFLASICERTVRDFKLLQWTADLGCSIPLDSNVNRRNESSYAIAPERSVLKSNSILQIPITILKIKLFYWL